MEPNPPTHLDDEALSALLDGDRATPAAATDDGPDPDGLDPATLHLAGCGQCRARQAALGAARAALAGAPVGALDELTRRRLLATALREFESGDATPHVGGGVGRPSRSRWARHPAFVGSAAAVVLAVLVGVPFVTGNHGQSSQSSSSEALATATTLGPGALGDAYRGDLGDLTDRDQLRLRLAGGRFDASNQEAYESPAGPLAPVAAPAPAVPAAPSAKAPAAGASPGGSSRPADTPAQATGSPAAKPASPAADSAAPVAEQQRARDLSADDRSAADACVAALTSPSGPARGGRLVGSGVGAFRGRPAVVVAFELGGGTVAFVADRSGCAVLDRFSL